MSSSELTADRDSHLRSVLALFQELDVFVFTLGLTEAWIRKKDGAVLPVCPGCGVGTFDDALYSFHNFDLDEVVTHCEAFLLALARVNPAASVILTVSPVPLAATMERGNVLLATSYSKAVLRVAAQTIVRRHRNVCYFPSYEIVTQSGNSQAYFAADRRTVTEPGISHVMSCFFRNFANVEFETLPRVEEVKRAVAASPVVCDEEELSKELAQRQSLKA